MIWSLNGAQITGKEVAKGSDQGMGAAIAGMKCLGSSDNEGVASYEVLSRVNIWLSRHCKSEKEGFAWLMSLLDGLSLPKSSAGTNNLWMIQCCRESLQSNKLLLTNKSSRTFPWPKIWKLIYPNLRFFSSILILQFRGTYPEFWASKETLSHRNTWGFL